MYTDLACCQFAGETTVGMLGSCHNAPPGQFLSFNLNPGSDLLEKGVWIFVYPGLDCSGTARSAKLPPEHKSKQH